MDCGGLRRQLFTRLAEQIQPLFSIIGSTVKSADPRFFISDDSDKFIADDLNARMRQKGVRDLEFKPEMVDRLYTIAGQLFAACLVNHMMISIPLSRLLIHYMAHPDDKIPMMQKEEESVSNQGKRADAETVDGSSSPVSPSPIIDNVVFYLIECFREEFIQHTMSFPQFVETTLYAGTPEDALQELADSYMISTYGLKKAHLSRLQNFIGSFRTYVGDMIKKLRVGPSDVFHACCANPNFRTVEELTEFMNTKVVFEPEMYKNDIVTLFTNIARRYVKNGGEMPQFMTYLMTWWTGSSVVQPDSKYMVIVTSRGFFVSASASADIDDKFIPTKSSTCAQTLYLLDTKLARWKRMEEGEEKSDLENYFVDLSGNYGFTEA